jgi:hypothetical protein
VWPLIGHLSILNMPSLLICFQLDISILNFHFESFIYEHPHTPTATIVVWKSGLSVEILTGSTAYFKMELANNHDTKN